MSIIYIFSTLLLIVSFIVIKKSDKKQNILFWIIMSTALLLSYNILVCGILSLICIKNTMISLSIINFIITLILGIITYKKKNIQKYYIKIKDVICLVILFITVCIVGYKHFGNPISIKYETTDPAIHFSATKDFYERKNMPTIKEGMMMPSAYVNTGIGMLVSSDFMIEENFHVVYVLFDLFILYLLAAVFYIGIIRDSNSKIKTIITLIFALIFIMGYPLNSMIFGFAYLSVGLLFVLSLLVCSRFVKNKELNMLTYCILFFAINFGIFFSYYLFVPVIYVAFGLYMLIDMIKNRKNNNIISLITKENIFKVFSTLLLPTILGFAYFVLPGLIQSGKTIVEHIIAEGYIYRDLYSNFVFFIPLTLFYLFYNIKNKKNSFSTILMIVSSLFTVYLLKKGLAGEASSYYYYKMYYLLWAIVLYIVAKACFKIINKGLSTYICGYIITYILIITLSINGFDKKISDINILFNPNNHLAAYTDIYMFNLQKIKEDKNIYSINQIRAIQDLIKKADNKSQIQINGDALKMLWAKDLYKITDTDDIHQLVIPIEIEQSIQEWLKNDKKRYLIYFDTSKNIEKESEKYRAIYESNDVIILEKK